MQNFTIRLRNETVEELEEIVNLLSADKVSELKITTAMVIRYALYNLIENRDKLLNNPTALKYFPDIVKSRDSYIKGAASLMEAMKNAEEDERIINELEQAV